LRQRFNVADLNAIETRVGAWLAQCHDLMAVFEPWTDPRGNFKKNGRDPYLSFGSKMYQIPFEKLYADYEGWNGKDAKLNAKRMRQIAKPGVLGAIYRLSGGMLLAIFTDGRPPEIWFEGLDGVAYTKKTGLWDYADKMGVDMSQKQAGEVVEIFRNSYPEICDPKIGIWKRLEDAVADVMHHPNTVRKIGAPGAEVVIDKISFESGRSAMMRMKLPSGRYLHYLDARLEPKLMSWKGVDEDGEPCDVYKNSLIYAGTNQKTKQWDIYVPTHGGKLFENLVQGISRDILGLKLLEFEDAGYNIVGHVHDEGISLVEDDFLSPTAEEMVGIMSKPVIWAPGLLLGADGYQDPYYHK